MLRCCIAVAIITLSLSARDALALSGATADATDRFSFVVEIKFQDQLICSGTVLFPRIVVTAAHCLQQKVYWRGGLLYVDEYLQASELTVTATHDGKTETYKVAEVNVSPVWRSFTAQSSSGQRFAYDLALVITEEPTSVDAPSSPLGTPPNQTVSEASQTERPVHQGMLVAFGGEHCSSLTQCDDAGVRRFLPVAIKENSFCFKKPRAGDPALPIAVWCMESNVMPGDSGGALLIKADNGQLYYVGVISAQQGLPLELAAVASWRRSLATSLYPNLPFIREKARELGYLP